MPTHQKQVDSLVPPQKNREHRNSPMKLKRLASITAGLLFLVLAPYTFDQNIASAFSYLQAKNIPKTSLRASVIDSVKTYPSILDAIASLFKAKPSPETNTTERANLVQQLPQSSELERLKQDVEALKSASPEEKQSISERIVERIQPITEVTQRIITLDDERLTNLEAQIKDLTSRLNIQSQQSSGVLQMVSQSQKLDKLKGITITDLTVSGLSGLTNADIPDSLTASNYLPLSGGTLTGALIGTSATLSTLSVTASATTTAATTTSFAISGITSSLLKTNSSGSIIPAVAETDYLTSASLFGKAFEVTTNAFSQTALKATSSATHNFVVDATGTSTFAGGLEAWRQIGAPFFNATSSTATSTFAGGLNVRAINQTGTATSTFARGIQLAAGCFEMSDGNCLTSGGSGDITDVWGCSSGNCNALTAASGDSLSAASADSSHPFTESTSAGSATEGQAHWETDRDLLWVGNGSSAVVVGGVVGTRLTNSADQSVTNAQDNRASFNTEQFDTDTMHYTSDSNLTGTVSKTNTSATITGSGSAFTSELSVGQVICVPDTAGSCNNDVTTSDFCVVTAIASDTSLTCNQNMEATASGVTAQRESAFIVARTAGVYLISSSIRWTSSSDGYCGVRLLPSTDADFADALVYGDTPGTNEWRQCNSYVIYQLAAFDAVMSFGNEDSAATAFGGDGTNRETHSFQMVKIN